MAVEVLAVVEPAAVVLDLMTSDELVAELARRGHLGKALAKADAEQHAGEWARRANEVIESSARVWAEAQQHTDDLAVLTKAVAAAKQNNWAVESFASIVMRLVPVDHRLTKVLLEDSKWAAVYYARTLELLNARRRYEGVVTVEVRRG